MHGARLPGPGVFEELSSAYTSARTTLSSMLELMSLEARQAGLALVWMVAWAVIAGVCIATAWLGLMAAVAMWAITMGTPPIAAVIAVVALNLVAGAILIYMCIGKSHELLFSATRRQVAGKSPVAPTTP